MMTKTLESNGMTALLLGGRGIFSGVFLMATAFKFAGMESTASYIATAGFPFPHVLAWIAAFFELALALCFASGAYFRQASLLAAAYVIFLAFTFHGPSHWNGNQAEFGFFVDHFTFMAGLFFATAHGPGRFTWTPNLFQRPLVLERN
jgi:uncharacterized membrane protein YphA (DoxX/SURF4 family)